MTELKALTVLSFHMFFRASHGFPADITAIEPTKAQMSIARWEKIALYQMLQKQSSFKLKHKVNYQILKKCMASFQTPLLLLHANLF